MIDWNDNSNDVNRVYLAHYLLSLHVTTACINASPHPPRHAYPGKVNKVHVETYINRYISVYCGVDAITSTLSTVQMYSPKRLFGKRGVRLFAFFWEALNTSI